MESTAGYDPGGLTLLRSLSARSILKRRQRRARRSVGRSRFSPRSCRHERARGPARSGGTAGPDRYLSALLHPDHLRVRRRGGQALRDRDARLFRPSTGARARRRTRSSRRSGPCRCGLETQIPAAPAPLQLRVGIATGPVVVGDLPGNGADQQVIIGEAVQLAGALERIAEPTRL